MAGPVVVDSGFGLASPRCPRTATIGGGRCRAAQKFCGTNAPTLALSWQPAAHFPLPVLGRCRGRSRQSVGYARVFRDSRGVENMFRRSRYLPAISSNLREIDGRLRTLERHLQRVGSRASENAEGISEAVASALSASADRFRGSATSVGSEAAKLGHDALRRLTDEAEERPLAMIAVALGVGILIGLSMPRPSYRG
jgi:ElaB/YqjD/DUF883 family membrane-anchored ribosome-binding protein